MIIKSYKIFEKKFSTEELYNLKDELIESSRGYSSFSFYGAGGRDTQHEYDKFIDTLERRGYPMSKIDMIYNKHKKEMIDDWQLTQSNGILDILFYNLSNKEYQLGGFGFIQEMGEPLYKYRYGFHRNDYGLLYLQQHYGLELPITEVKKKFLLDMARNAILHLFSSETDSNVHYAFKEIGLYDYAQEGTTDNKEDLEEILEDSIRIEDFHDGNKIIMELNKQDFEDSLGSIMRFMRSKNVEKYEAFKLQKGAFLQSFYQSLGDDIKNILEADYTEDEESIRIEFV